MQLYELAQSYQELYQKAAEEETDSALLSSTLAAIDDAFDDKAEKTAYVVKNLEADAKALGDEIKRLQGRKKRAERNAQSLKDYLFDHMSALDKRRIKTPYMDISIRNNPKSVKVDESHLPADYFVETRRADKAKIKAALQAGEAVPGAELIQKQSLQIR